MKLVHRYMTASFFRLFALTAIAFLSLFLLVTIFENLNVILKNRASFGDALLFVALQTPWMVAQSAPLASLVAALVSLSLMSRNGEVTALRAAGVPIRRLAIPFLLSGLLLTGTVFWLQETVVPKTSRLAREIRDARIKMKAGPTLLRVQDVWLRSGNAMVKAGRVIPTENRMDEVTVFERENDSVHRYIHAARADWTPTGWRLADVRDIHFEAGKAWDERRLDTLDYPRLAPPPSEITVSQRKSEEIGIIDLYRRIRSHRAQGLNVTGLQVDFWAKTSLPFTCLILPLLAVPFSLRSSRRTGLWAGVASGLGIGLFYLLVLLLGVSLGRTGSVPPWLAAWMGNFLFIGLTILLYRRAERGG